MLQKGPAELGSPSSTLKSQGGAPLLPAMSTLCIAAGRKDKVRPGDILGALTGDAGIPGAQVGKIAIFRLPGSLRGRGAHRRQAGRCSA
jgi:ATP-dependent RNA helicase DbpA